MQAIQILRQDLKPILDETLRRILERNKLEELFYEQVCKLVKHCKVPKEIQTLDVNFLSNCFRPAKRTIAILYDLEDNSTANITNIEKNGTFCGCLSCFHLFNICDSEKCLKKYINNFLRKKDDKLFAAVYTTLEHISI